MSERTISPGTDRIKSAPATNNMEMGPTSRPPGSPALAKRKWSPDHSDTSTATLKSQHETTERADTASPSEGHSLRESKRVKVDESVTAPSRPTATVLVVPLDRTQLPGEMWQYIFTYLSPYSLGRLMKVNKTFHSLLAPDGLLPAPQLDAHGPLRLINQEHLWSLSRRAFLPGMPRPIFPYSELGTWKLVQGNGCEFCGRTNFRTSPPVSASPWAAGPGHDYVRVVWPFAVRSCGNCLRKHLQKVCVWYVVIFALSSDTAGRKRICSSPALLPCYLRYPLHSSVRH